MAAWIALGLLVIAGVVFMVMGNPGETFGIEDADLANLVAGIALLIWIGSSLIFSYRGRAGLAVRQAVTWLALALAIMVGYTYRHDFAKAGRRIAGEFLPGTPVVTQTGSGTGQSGRRVVAITAREGGQFDVSTLVNGTHVNMLADTGATVIALNNSDAQRVGIDLARLRYTVPVSTANGRAMSARVRLKTVSVGGIELHDVEALVTKPGALRGSLLGMSFLGRIGSFEISGERLLLRE